MAIPVLLIYSLIGIPTEANGFVGYSQERFGYELAGAVGSGESGAQVRLNSVGGNWVEAQGIFGMIKASALKIDTYNDGIAASSASLIFMAGRKRLMSAHARLMIHNCSGGAQGGIDDLQKAIVGQQAINDSMATVYANATGLPIEQIREMMAAETWLSADEALALGFATGIINNEKKALQPAAELTASAEHLLQLQAYYAEHLPSNNSNMKHLLLPILTANAVAGITATATDEQCTAAVTAAFTELGELRTSAAENAQALATAQQELTEATTAKETAELKVAELEKAQTDAAAEQQQLQAQTVVADAVAAGKITAEQQPHFMALATASLSTVQAVLSTLPARQSITETIQAQASGGSSKITAAGAMAEINAKGTGK